MQSKNIFNILKPFSDKMQAKSKPKQKSTPKNKKQETLFFLNEFQENHKSVQFLKKKQPRTNQPKKQPKSTEKTKAKKAQKKSPAKKKNSNKKVKIEYLDRSIVNICDTTVDEIPNYGNSPNMQIDEIFSAPLKFKDQVAVNTPKKRGRPKKIQTDEKPQKKALNKKQQSAKKQLFTSAEKNAQRKNSANKQKENKSKTKNTNTNTNNNKANARANFTKTDHKLLKLEEIKVNSPAHSLKNEPSSVLFHVEIDEIDKNSEISFKHKLVKRKLPNLTENAENPLLSFSTLTDPSVNYSLEKSSSKMAKGLRIITSENQTKSNSDLEAETDEEESDSPPGCFDYDVPLRIEKFTLNEANDVFVVLSWKTRYDGSIPRKSIFPAAEVYAQCPNLLSKYLLDKISKGNANRK